MHILLKLKAKTLFIQNFIYIYSDPKNDIYRALYTTYFSGALSIENI